MKNNCFLKPNGIMYFQLYDAKSNNVSSTVVSAGQQVNNGMEKNKYFYHFQPVFNNVYPGKLYLSSLCRASSKKAFFIDSFHMVARECTNLCNSREPKGMMFKTKQKV